LKAGLGRPIQILQRFKLCEGSRIYYLKGFQKAILKMRFYKPGKKLLNSNARLLKKPGYAF
jgi:hypothetical protein